jgi:hypothetical protein
MLCSNIVFCLCGVQGVETEFLWGKLSRLKMWRMMDEVDRKICKQDVIACIEEVGHTESKLDSQQGQGPATHVTPFSNSPLARHIGECFAPSFTPDATYPLLHVIVTRVPARTVLTTSTRPLSGGG